MPPVAPVAAVRTLPADLLAGRRIYITQVADRHLSDVETAYDIKVDGASVPVLDARESGRTLVPSAYSGARRGPPIHVEIGRPGGPALLVARGGADVFHPNLEVTDRRGRFVASFHATIFAIGVTYIVRDAFRKRRWRMRSDFEVQRWRFLDGNQEIARISGGRIEVAPTVAPDDPVRPYLLFAGFLALHWRFLNEHR